MLPSPRLGVVGGGSPEAAQATGRPVFSLTVADFFHAPSVDEVDLSGYKGAVGDEIVIMAHDDFDVKGVSVALTQAPTE